MAVAVRVNLQGDERFRRMLARLPPSSVSVWLRQSMQQAGFYAQRTAATKFIKPGGDAPPIPEMLTSRTGELRRSIETDQSELPWSVSIGSALEYSRVHELGISPMPSRPYLKPAMQFGITSGKFAQIFLRAWSRVASDV